MDNYTGVNRTTSTGAYIVSVVCMNCGYKNEELNVPQGITVFDSICPLCKCKKLAPKTMCLSDNQ